MKMKWITTRLVCLILVSIIALYHTEVRATQDNHFMKGIAVMLYGPFDDVALMKYNTPLFYQRIANMNVNSLALVFPIFQANSSALFVYRDQKYTPSNEILSIVIDEAHKRGISILLKPVLDEGNLKGWRGAITPGGSLDNLKALDQWFESYSTFIIDVAKFAESRHVEYLSIGTEFESVDKNMPKYTQRWTSKVIAPVRTVYKGLITYASNWNDGSTNKSGAPGFAKQLDFLTIDAFYDLNAKDSSLSELQKAWKRWADTDIKSYFDYKLPIVFGEVGVSARKGGYKQPWNADYCPNRDDRINCPSQIPADTVHPLFDPIGQANYYHATCEVARDLKLSGMYWWEVDFYAFTRSHSLDSSHSPLDKPAESEISWCYSEVFK